MKATIDRSVMVDLAVNVAKTTITEQRSTCKHIVCVICCETEIRLWPIENHQTAATETGKPLHAEA